MNMSLKEITYEEAWNAVQQYYDKPDLVINEVNVKSFRNVDFFDAFSKSGESKIPGLYSTWNSDGSQSFYRVVEDGLGDEAIDITDQLSTALNSNNSPGKWYKPKSAKISTPVKVSVDDTTEVVTVSKASQSAGLQAIKQVGSGIVAVSTGIALGKAIDSLLYSVNPDFWDSHNMSSLNPETWHDITIDGGTVPDKLFNMLFSNGDGTTQAYVESNVIGYMAAYMQEQNALESRKVIYDNPSLPGYGHIPAFGYSPRGSVYWYGGGSRLTPELGVWCKNGKVALFKTSIDSNSYMVVAATKDASFDFEYPEGHQRLGNGVTYSYDGRTVRYAGYTTTSEGLRNAVGNFNYVTEEEYRYLIQFSIDHYLHMGEAAWRMIYGAGSSGNIQGVTDQDGATTPVLFDISNISGVVEQLEEQYPELFENKITIDVMNADGTISQKDYIPVGFPSELTKNQPTSSTSTQTNPEVNPQTSSQDIIDTLIKTLTDPGNTNPPNTGTGNTPDVILPTGSASSLWAIYNPTQAQVDSFGSWLWSSNFVEQIKKLFADPMQAIIGLHKVFATPSTGTSQNIKVGYLDSGVSSAIVTNQYTTVDCGTVSVLEYFGNVFDYAPYTEIKLFLPFIGFVNLDTADVMRSTVGVKYHVDVLSGACLAEVTVTRDSGGGILYSFAGNCSVSYPVSSGNYASIMASLIGAVVSVGAATIGAAPVSVAGTALNRLAHTRTSVEHSGGFSGHSGAMGVKTPYIVITRPQTAVADSYETLQGRPANNFVRIGSLSGFNRISKVHVEGVSATSDELDMIESILKSGIIV